MTENYCWS